MDDTNDKTPVMVSVRVSEASRADARRDPSECVKFDSYREEYEHYVKIAQQCDAELAGYRKSYYTSEQARIRREFPASKSLDVWLKRRDELDRKRQEWIKKKTNAQSEMSRLKNFVKMEKERSLDDQGNDSLRELVSACLDELRSIRRSLEKQN